MTPDLGDGVGGGKVKAREFQVRLAWDIVRLPQPVLPPECEPSSWTMQKTSPGGASTLYTFSLTGLKSAGKMSLSGTLGPPEHSLPLLSGARFADTLKVADPRRSGSSRLCLCLACSSTGTLMTVEGLWKFLRVEQTQNCGARRITGKAEEEQFSRKSYDAEVG